ncbi:MAG: hypothetical protein RMY29_024970 [Nostoc sp. CreGUA01]|nr:hypothetical protein [Nostoc sp. CreGUA01]
MSREFWLDTSFARLFAECCDRYTLTLLSLHAEDSWFNQQAVNLCVPIPNAVGTRANLQPDIPRSEPGNVEPKSQKT